MTLRQIFRLLGALGLLFLTCQSSTAQPKDPGTSTKLRYPVLLIGQGTIDVRDDELKLVTVRGHSMLNLVERALVDADGRMFAITKATAVKDPGVWLSMGNADRLFFIELKERPRPAFEDIRKLVLEQVTARISVWQGDPKAVARVMAFKNLEELTTGSRESWNWAR